MSALMVKRLFLNKMKTSPAEGEYSSVFAPLNVTSNGRTSRNSFVQIDSASVISLILLEKYAEHHLFL